MGNIHINDVKFKYKDAKDYALEDINIQINDKEFVCITGANGTGKSTILKLLLGIEKPTSGTVDLGNEKISYVSQKASNVNKNFPATVYEVVKLGMLDSKKKLSKKEVDCKINDTLKSIGIENLKYNKIGNLSGGQQQRVFIAKALISNPTLIILDEATSSIDKQSRGDICCLLGELNKEKGITIIMVTHDMPSIINHATQIVNFGSDGKVVSMSSTEYKKIMNELHI